MSTIIIISPPPPPPPDKRAESVGINVPADGCSHIPPDVLLGEWVARNERATSASRTTAYNAALRALNDAFNDGAEIRVIDA